MGKLLYSAIAAFDGYVADHEGRFDWAVSVAAGPARVGTPEAMA
jgi:hypothetical protein